MKKWIILLFGLGFGTFVLLTLVSFFFGTRFTGSVSQPQYYGDGVSESQSVAPLGSVGVGMMNPILPSLDFERRQVSKTLPQPPVLPEFSTDDALDVDERVYRKSSRYDVVVDEVASYMQQLREFVLSIDGRVLTSNMQSQGKVTYGLLHIKVPVEKFEETNSRVVSGVDQVVNEQVSAEDETGTVVSIQDQITDLENQIIEKKLEKQQEVDEIKKQRIQIEIDRLEKQLEQVKERLDSAEATVEYATVYARIANTAKYFNPSQEESVNLWDEVKEAWSSVFAILLVLARVVIWIVIYGVLWLPVVILVRVFSGKMRKPVAGNSGQEGEKK